METIYNYHESDDPSASIYGMSYEQVMALIEEHNDYFETEYKSIDEFNDCAVKADGIRYIEKGNLNELVENYISWFYHENANPDEELWFLIDTILSSDKKQKMLDVMSDLMNEQKETE